MNDNALDAMFQLQRWHREGKVMPKYVLGNGNPYLAYLLGIYDGHPWW